MRRRQREHFSLPWSLARSQMKGFGYDGAALSGPHQSVTPKLVVCLSQGGLQSVCSQCQRLSLFGIGRFLCICVCVCMCMCFCSVHSCNTLKW